MAIFYSQLPALISVKPFKYNSTDDFLSEFVNSTNGKEPGFGLNSLNGGLSYLKSHLSNRRPEFDLTTILITYSSSNMYDIREAVAESQLIDGDIIIVGVGNIDTTNLYYLSGTVITTDTYFLSNIAEQINNAICQPPVPPSPLPTLPPTQSTQSSSESPTSSTGSTTPSSQPYIPCSSNIVFAIDASSDISLYSLDNVKALTTTDIVQVRICIRKLSKISFPEKLDSFRTSRTHFICRRSFMHLRFWHLQFQE